MSIIDSNFPMIVKKKPASEHDAAKDGDIIGMSYFWPLVVFEKISMGQANRLLLNWQHKMGPIVRGAQTPLCHALISEARAVAVTTTSSLMAPNVGGGCDWMTRENTIELSRLCAARPGLCRVALRLWREFVFPTLGKEFAVSYQDADLHHGNTYRFDGWKRVGKAHSGKDTRSGRPGRDKWVWVWGVLKK